MCVTCVTASPRGDRRAARHVIAPCIGVKALSLHRSHADLHGHRTCVLPLDVYRSSVADVPGVGKHAELCSPSNQMQKEHLSQGAQHACLLLPAPQLRSHKKQRFVPLVVGGKFVKDDSIWRSREAASSGLQDALYHHAQIQSQLEHCQVALAVSGYLHKTRW